MLLYIGSPVTYFKGFLEIAVDWMNNCSILIYKENKKNNHAN